VNWHRSRATDGPAEAINNLVKRVKRAAFGFRKFRHYRIRALLYAGRPDWNLLATVTPPEIRGAEIPVSTLTGSRFDQVVLRGEYEHVDRRAAASSTGHPESDRY